MQHLPIYNKVYRKLLEDFSQHLVRIGHNPGSQTALPSHVQEFFYWLEQGGVIPIEEITPNHIRKHYDYLTERPNQTGPGGLGSSILAKHMYAIKTFLNYQQENGKLTSNPFGVLSLPKTESSPRQVLSQAEIKALYQTTENMRDKAILGLFYGCGLRRSEAEKLNINDLHFKGQLLYVRQGKGKKRRVVPLTNQVKADLQDYYLYERNLYVKQVTTDNQNAFMLNNWGDRMLGGGYWKRMKYLTRKASLPEKISLHHLRHSIATHLLESGLSIEQVRDFLGHRYLESTQIYTRVSNIALAKLEGSASNI